MTKEKIRVESLKKGGIEGIKTFAGMVELLERHSEIEWERGKDGTLQGNYFEGNTRYRIKLFDKKEGKKFPRSLPVGGDDYMSHRVNPDYSKYKYGVEVLCGKEKVIEFCGEHSTASSDKIEKGMAEIRRKSYLPRADFIVLWKIISARVSKE